MTSDRTADTPEPPAPRRAGLPRNVKVLAVASLFNDIATEIVFPLLPSFLLTVLHGNKFSLGAIEGAADSLASLLKLWSGSLSDRLGNRKRFVFTGYALASIVRPLIGLVTHPWQLMAIRLTDRFGKGLRAAPRDAVIASSTDQTNRGWAFGFHRAMDHVGAAVGPLLATLFLYFFPDQLRTLFLLTLIPGLCVVVLIGLGLREPAQTAEPRPASTLSWAPFDRNFRLFLAALVIFNLGNSTDSFLLLRAEELGLPKLYLPALWSVFHIAKSLANLYLGRLVDRQGPRRLLYAGWGVYALVYLGFGLATSVWEVWVWFLVYALYYGLAEPAEKTLVAHLAGPHRRGLAYGWYNFAIGLTMLPASLLFGAIYQTFGAVAAFTMGALFSLTGTALFRFVRDPAPPAAT
ncbi:MAG: MFS transporter [Planctomycetes bacterium]|nr:MFS transporter [Planctomycetota bacterium]